MIKVIFSDLDKTLVVSKNISNKNICAINKFNNIGGLFIIISGRSISYLRKITSNINNIRYIIGNNGSIIYDNKNNKVIYSNLIDYDSILNIYNICNKYDAKILLSGIKYDYVNKDAFYNQKIYTKIDKKLVEENYVTQMIIVTYNKESILSIINDINKLDNVKVVNKSRTLYDDSYKSNNYWINICKNMTNKGVGVIKMCNYLNIDISDTLRVGDDLNDLPMFFDKGINVAMENGYEKLKEKADKIALSCNNDGISYLIEDVIKNNK